MKNETQTNNGNVNMARRSFLRYAGAGVAGMGLLATAASCHKDHGVNPIPGVTDVGSGDLGILNYAYALEQLEAAFYTQIIKTPYSGISAYEKASLTDIRDHEIAHREFFKAALGAKAIKALTPDFSSINFSSRDSVLGAAMTFEDLGVTAYDGVGYLIEDTDYLVTAGKIVSVEARHAAFIRSLIKPGTDYFATAPQLDASSVNISNVPSAVLAAANTYLVTKVSAKSFA
jgi:rubrerythrin